MDAYRLAGPDELDDLLGIEPIPRSEIRPGRVKRVWETYLNAAANVDRAVEALVTRATADDREEDIWAIDGSKEGASELMGLISLHKMDRDQSEVAYWVAPPYHH